MLPSELYEDKAYFSFEELVADDRRDCAEWNAALHPDQKRYPNMSRWEILISYLSEKTDMSFLILFSWRR